MSSQPGRPVRLPADIDLEDRIAFGLTARQLVILAAAALLCYGILTAVSSALGLPVGLLVALPVALAGIALALGRLDGLSGDRAALAAVRHLAWPRRRLAAPNPLPARLPGAPAQPAACLLDVPVRTVLAGGVVELADGSSALILAAAGASWELRAREEQQALTEAYGRFLNSLAEPAAITVRSQPVDLAAHAAAIGEAAAALPHPALRDCAAAYTRFLADLAGQGLRRRQILLVLSTRTKQRQAAVVTLQRRASEAESLLAGAGVRLQALNGEQAAALLGAVLEPPGPPAGCRLDGVIEAAR